MASSYQESEAMVEKDAIKFIFPGKFISQLLAFFFFFFFYLKHACTHLCVLNISW